MPGDPARYQELLMSKMDIVRQLTELNSRHIKTECSLAGIEVHLARCHEAIDSGGDTTGAHEVAIKDLEREYMDIVKTREKIDKNRDNLDTELQDIDKQLHLLDE